MKLSQIPFIHISRTELDKLADLYNKEKVSLITTTYVALDQLKALASDKEFNQWSEYFTPMVMSGTVGFMSPNWVNRYKGGSLKFATGSYVGVHTILLFDDIYDWSQGRKTSEEVRSAWDIIKELRNDDRKRTSKTT